MLDFKIMVELFMGNRNKHLEFYEIVISAVLNYINKNDWPTIERPYPPVKAVLSYYQNIQKDSFNEKVESILDLTHECIVRLRNKYNNEEKIMYLQNNNNNIGIIVTNIRNFLLPDIRKEHSYGKCYYLNDHSIENKEKIIELLQNDNRDIYNYLHKKINPSLSTDGCYETESMIEAFNEFIKEGRHKELVEWIDFTDSRLKELLKCTNHTKSKKIEEENRRILKEIFPDCFKKIGLLYKETVELNNFVIKSDYKENEKSMERIRNEEIKDESFRLLNIIILLFGQKEKFKRDFCYYMTRIFIDSYMSDKTHKKKLLVQLDNLYPYSNDNVKYKQTERIKKDFIIPLVNEYGLNPKKQKIVTKYFDIYKKEIRSFPEKVFVYLAQNQKLSEFCGTQSLYKQSTLGGK